MEEREREDGEKWERNLKITILGNNLSKNSSYAMPKLPQRIDFCLELRAISFVCKCSHVKSSKRILVRNRCKILLLLFFVLESKATSHSNGKKNFANLMPLCPMKLVWLTFILDVSKNVFDACCSSSFFSVCRLKP